MLTVVRLQSLRLWASNHWNWLYFLGRLFLLWSEVVPFLKTHHENDNNHRSQKKKKIKTPPIFPHVHTFVFFHRNYFKHFYTRPNFTEGKLGEGDCTTIHKETALDVIQWRHERTGKKDVTSNCTTTKVVTFLVWHFASRFELLQPNLSRYLTLSVNTIRI